MASPTLAKSQLLKSDIEVTVSFNNCFNNDLATHAIEQEILAVIQALDSDFAGKISLQRNNGNSTRGLKARVEVATQVGTDSIKDLYNSYYDDHNFTFVVDQEVEDAHVINTNKCLMNITASDGKLVITSVIDALLKGSAGNAVHVMNLLFGLHEKVGLALKAQVF